MNTGIWGWDYAVAPNVPQWRRVHLDRATGNLQVDVVASGLPLGAATAANQATIIGHIDDIEANLGRCYGFDTANWQYLQVQAAAFHNLRVTLYDGGSKSVLDAMDGNVSGGQWGLLVASGTYGYDGANWLAIEREYGAIDALPGIACGLLVSSRLYGYNGATWDRLRTESAAAFNLRVKLYDGANGIDTVTGCADMAAERGLVVKAIIHGRVAANASFSISAVNTNADNISINYRYLTTVSVLYGFNGVGWDRLRTWGLGVLKVAKGDIAPTRIRVTATGRVGVAGAKKLFWVACSPDSPAAEWELTDADAGGGAVVYDHFDSDKHSEQIDFDPPMEFATGIWVEKFDHMHSLVFCYV